MELKPTDIVLALMQFLEILLPGALVAFVSNAQAGKYVFGPQQILPAIAGEAQGWVIFFFASYLLGHFVFLIASFLDDYAYNPVRERWKPLTKDLAYQRATSIKRRRLHDDKQEIVNTFQWAKARLNLEHPSALAEIKRNESDSKFFRSLVIVFFAFAILEFSQGRSVSGVGCLAFSALSFLRYVDQRWKSTQIAYIHLIAMEDLGRGRPQTE
ncbi:MAG TPA: hypothetical protein VGG72_01395 [Bryobacteraceae bacterium]|jgi:hypothetical protein